MTKKLKYAGLVLVIAAVLVGVAYLAVISLKPYYEDWQYRQQVTLIIARKDVASIGPITAYYAKTDNGQWYRTSEEVFIRLGLGRQIVIITKRDGEDYILEIVKEGESE
jgi:hypothetical protein